MKKTVFALFMVFAAAFLFAETIDMNRATASSSLTDSQGSYAAENLVDRSWRTWAEGVRGSGIGEYFTLEDRYNGNRLRLITAAGFALKNGYGNLDHYAKNNRVKAFRIYADDKYIETIAVKDSIGFEQYAFKTPITFTRLCFVIDDVYRGTMYDDTCIAEIDLLDEISGEDEFYENILFWLEQRGNIRVTMYTEHDERVASLPDIDNDKALLRNYLPFLPINPEDGKPFAGLASKIARLGKPASLRLAENLPRLDGATAMYPLYSAFAGAVYPAKELNPKENAHAALSQWGYLPSYELVREMLWGSWGFEEEYASVVQCGTTPVAYERLINGEADIVFCYEPSEAEKAAAAAKGITLRLTPIAKDAFVFIVNDKNTLANITTRQIRDIYSGRVTNWQSVSGVDEPVIAYQRPENSGSQTILQTIMQGDTIARPLLDGKRESIPGEMFSMIRKVASDYYNYNAAIGYTFMFYLNMMAGTMGTKALAVDGVAPSPQSVRSGAYPFTQTVYAVTAGNENENTQVFIDWILSAEGQELVAKTGYVPVR